MEKGIQFLLYQAMVATILALVEEGELDQGRAVNWIDVHTTNVVENEGKYRVEIVVERVDADGEEDADADGS